MASYVDVANVAASAIGESSQLRAPDEDTPLGRAVTANWDIARRSALRAHNWNFAKRYAALAAQVVTDTSTLGPWSYSYRLPSASLRLIRVRGCSREHYECQGKTILARQPGPLNVEHLIDIPEPASWDDMFVDAFGAYLGFKIADRVTGDADRKKTAWTLYKAAIADALRANAIENPRIQEEPTSWETSRMGWGEDEALYGQVYRGSATYP